MKKIALSLMTIAVVVTFAVGATSAYFSDTKVVRQNTFSTGSVVIGSLEDQHITVTNLAPGQWSTNHYLKVPYVGNLPADIYVGVRGTSSPTSAAYLADKLYVKVYNYGTTDVVWEGWANTLSTEWTKIASNVTVGDKWFSVDFYLDPSVGNSKQNVTNSDTEFLIYATQAGSNNLPTTKPYLTW